MTDLLTLSVEVDEGVAGGRNVLRCNTLVHAVDVEVKTAVTVHQQTQHRPLRTSVQIRTVVLTYLRKRVINREKMFCFTTETRQVTRREMKEKRGGAGRG